MCVVGSTPGWMADRETTAALGKTTAQRGGLVADVMFAAGRVGLSHEMIPPHHSPVPKPPT